MERLKNSAKKFKGKKLFSENHDRQLLFPHKGKKLFSENHDRQLLFPHKVTTDKLAELTIKGLHTFSSNSEISEFKSSNDDSSYTENDYLLGDRAVCINHKCSDQFAQKVWRLSKHSKKQTRSMVEGKTSRCLDFTPGKGYEKLKDVSTSKNSYSDPKMPVIQRKSTCETHSTQYYSSTDLSSPSLTMKTASVLTILERGIHTRYNEKKYQTYMGRIQLSIDASSVHRSNKELIVTVSGAFDLSSTATFVQVALVGPASKVKYHETNVVSGSCDPIYQNNRFIFVLKRKDYKKRIIVSVYEYNSTNNYNQIIGCTSFGVDNVINKRTVVDGWYYLLAKRLGYCKHMRVSQTESHSSETRSEGSTNGSETSGYVGSSDSSFLNSDDDCERYDMNHTQENMSSFYITITKELYEVYGLTLINGYPSTISNISSGSASEHTGVKIGDQVIGVNGHEVSAMYAEDVGGIIRCYPKKIVLEVLRQSS